jgi:clan AA aspartic protease
MGKTLIKVKMWNILNEEKIHKKKIKPIEIEAQVDNGATTTVLPVSIAKELKLIKTGITRVKYADERIEEREVAMGLRIEVMGRDTECRVILEPNRTIPLLGQIVLEDLDLWIDSKNGKLIPNPESPDMPLLDEL